MAGLAGNAQAGVVPYSGTFANDDELYILNFTMSAAGTFSAFTTSWAGGGFAPVLTLFGAAGGVQQDVGSARDCGSTPHGSADATNGACWDAFISSSLDAGTYTLVLSQDGNGANGISLADGFQQDGVHDYTGVNFLGAPGATCIDALGGQRGCNWALTVQTPDAQPPTDTPLPEPGSIALAGAALAALRMAQRRRKTC